MDFLDNCDISKGNNKRKVETRKGSGGKPTSATTATTATATTTKHEEGPPTHEESRNCKVHPLLPPQRLAIPQVPPKKEKEYHSLENKPLVQWESSDESEEELSFFPAGKSRGVLTDNLSIDSQSMEEEDEDLHLSPPRPLSGKNCFCCELCIII